MFKIFRIFLIILICFTDCNFTGACVIESSTRETTSTVISCDGNNGMNKFYWDIYLTAVKNIQPYIGKCDPVIVFGWKTGGHLPVNRQGCTFSYLVITKSGKCYLLDKCPNVLSNYIDTEANYLIDQYDVSDIKKLFQCEGYDFFEDMFDVSQYSNCISTNLEKPSTTFLPYFYAMFDEKDQIHGATIMSIDNVSNIPGNYISAMFVALFKSLERLVFNCSWEQMQLTEVCH